MCANFIRVDAKRYSEMSQQDIDLQKDALVGPLKSALENSMRFGTGHALRSDARDWQAMARLVVPSTERFGFPKRSFFRFRSAHCGVAKLRLAWIRIEDPRFEKTVEVGHSAAMAANLKARASPISIHPLLRTNLVRGNRPTWFDSRSPRRQGGEMRCEQ